MFRRSKKSATEGTLAVAISSCSVIMEEFSEADDTAQLCGFTLAYIEALGRSEYGFRGCDENFLTVLWNAVVQRRPLLAEKFSLFALSFVASGELIAKAHPALALRDFLQDSKWGWTLDSDNLQEWMATFLAVIRKLMADNSRGWAADR